MILGFVGHRTKGVYLFNLYYIHVFTIYVIMKIVLYIVLFFCLGNA